MRVQRQLSIDVPIPAALPPAAVVAALQTFSPVIRHLGTLSRYEPIPPHSDIVANDSFFAHTPHQSSSSASAQNGQQPQFDNQQVPAVSSHGFYTTNLNGVDITGGVAGVGTGVEDNLAISCFQVYEVITLAPGLTKEVNYPTHFQRVPNGLRCRADGAARIIGWCEFIVRPKRDPNAASPPAAATPPDLPSWSSPAEEYELHEAMLIEANSLLMPFVLQTMGVAHRGLCNKILNEVMQQYYDSQQNPMMQQS